MAPGVELLGEYEGSGFKEPRYLARRADAQIVQLTELLYLILEEIDGSRGYDEIAARVTERYGKNVTADNIQTLVDDQLRPRGFLEGHEGAQPVLEKPDPLLALKFRFTLIPESVVNVFAGLLRPLFWPPVIVAALVGVIALDVWYFGVHGIAQSLRDLIYQPLVVLMIYGLLVLSIAWHELGHATACRYGGARPGRIGFGIYVIWPAFFTDVSDALTLGKGGRVRTDLGGIYFNLLFSLAIGGVYLLTGFEPLLMLITLQHVLILYNLLPFLRLDGYHAVSDITGIPDLFARIKPTLKGAVPWKETPNAVAELKPWARTVVFLWVAMVIPVLVYFFAMMILSIPRVVGTGLDSVLLQWDRAQGSLDEGRNAAAAVAGLQAAMIVMPATGMFVSLARVGKRIVAGYMSFTRERPVLRGCFGAVGLCLIAVAAWTLYPNGEYRPIQPDEKWTIDEGIEATAFVSSGRPSLSDERAEELNGAPTLRETGSEFEPSYRDPSGQSSTGTESGDTSGGETGEQGSEDDAEGEAGTTPSPTSTTTPSDSETSTPAESPSPSETG